MKQLHNTKGSLVVETAILLPVFVAFLLFGCACLSFYVQYFRVQQCLYRTAECLSDYAYLYHEKTISKVTAQWREAVKEGSSSFYANLMKDVPKELQELLPIQSYLEAYENDLLDQAESQIYIPVAHMLFQHYLKKADLADSVTAVQFGDSRFFQNDSRILLHLTCEVPFPVPFLQKHTVQLQYSVCTNGWLKGIGGKQEAPDKIWEADNFTRGRKIRSLYGGNLPEQFPTIAKFQNGRATMIKSVDFRKETYQHEGALSANLITMLETLYRYDGQKTPYGKDKIVILPWQITEKELLLVIPNTVQSAMIQQELKQAEQWASSHHILFTVAKL